MSAHLWIVCPCYFDCASFVRLREEILVGLRTCVPALEAKFVLVDDSAGQDPEVAALHFSDVFCQPSPYNLGHQSALVYALRNLAPEVAEDDYILTMDSDGEDRPVDVPALLAPLLQAPQQMQLVSLACRTYRKQTLSFTVLYECFKLLFVALTGVLVRSGNFLACRGWLLKNAIFHPHFNLCYSSTWISLPFHAKKVYLPRGERFAGRSKMGFMGLITHGIRMLMPFSERIAVRCMLLASVFLGGGALAGAWAWSSNATSLWMWVPAALSVIEGSILLGFSILLFATFAQTKSTDLAGLSKFHRT